MFIKNTWKEKVIASLLVFCLMFAHSSTIFAAFLVDFSQDANSDITANVEMSAYISSETVEKTDAYVANTKEEGLMLNVLMKVTGGYVKNPMLSIADLEDEVFEIDETRLDCEYIQSIVGNEITISRLNEGEEVLVEIPIKLKNENYYNPFRSSSNIRFVLEGTYVDTDSNHMEFSKEVTTSLGWDSICNFDIASGVEKSFEYTSDEMKYMLVQYSIDIELNEESKTLPVESTNITFKVPENESLIPQTVSVDAVNTAFTNGLIGNDVLFNESNWNYTDGNVNISVLNSPVQEEDNKYIIPQNKDKYIITVVYAVNGEDTKLSSNILSNISVFNNGGTKLLEVNGEVEYDLSDSTGNLVTYDVESSTNEISKGNIYANYNINKDFYETDYVSTLDINISKADLVNTVEVREQEEYFEDDEGNQYSTLDSNTYNTYYKTTTFNKENLDSILGETGSLKILNEEGDVLLTLDKSQQADENGNIVVNYAAKVGKVIFRIDNPEKEGILSVISTKSIGNLTYSKQTAMRFEKLVSRYVAAAIYDGDIQDDLGVVTNNINLKGTTTAANISTGRKVLSTLLENEDIELKIALNNYNDSTDLYKNPVFEITFPREIEEVTVNDMSILYGNNELSISNVETYKNSDGNVVIKVSLEGVQTKYSLVELTEGTNVLLNVDIKANLYTPSKTSKIVMNYYNESATSYENDVPWRMDEDKNDDTILNSNGTSETEISFIAPSGVVSAQKAEGYNGKNEVYSISQGLKTDRILTNTESKRVTSEIIVMNNSGEDMNNVSVLGRTGTVGNKLISTNEDLGTTVDTQMISELSETYGTYKNVEVYYSENVDATKEITDPNNGWTTEFSSLDNVKSYLIVFNESIKSGEITVFSYTYEIPENLPCDTGIYTTFNTYYTNANNENVSAEADTIGLETVSSPKIEVSITSDAGDVVIEGQMIEYTVLVKNVGEEVAEDVNVTLNIPENTTYVEYISGDTNGGGYYERHEDISTVNIDVGNIGVGEEKSYTYVVQVNEQVEEISGATIEASAEGLEENDEEETTETPETPEEETPDTPDTEDPEQTETEENESITEDSTDTSEVEKADIELDFKENYAGDYVRENAEIFYYITIVNNTDESLGITEVIYPDGTVKTYEEYQQEQAEKKAQEEADRLAQENGEYLEETETEEGKYQFIRGKTLTNIVLQQSIPEGVTFDDAYIKEYNEEIQFNEDVSVGSYNNDTRTFTLELDELAVGESYNLTVRVKSDYIEEIEKSIESQVVVSADDIEDITSYKIKNKIGRPNIETTFTSSADSQYVQENDKITYSLVAKNTGVFSAENLTVIDLLPDELKGLNGKYYLESDPDNVKSVNFITANKMSMVVNLAKDDTLYVEINTRAREIDDDETAVDNYLTLESISFREDIETDSITTILQQRPDTSSNDDSGGGNNSVAMIERNETVSNTSEAIPQRITGRAWLDENKDGKRDSDEKGLANISATLYSAETNKSVSKTTTDGSGTYIFDNLENGKYYIVFSYDTSKYALTEYQSEDVDSSMNSDVILTNALAITDIITIQGNSVGNIDIGLIEASVFDLTLDKTVTKITVQTEEETRAYDFEDGTDFAKIDIHSRQLQGAMVYMEYKVTVSNKGELAGYASTLVDYIPEGTVFSTDLNPGWYEGPDGLIYSNALENELINPGEGKSISLILVKQMTTTNTGMVSNSAEIAETFNEEAVEDADSIPGNRVDSEDDLGTADIVISVETGGTFISGAVFVVFVIIALVGVYIFKKNVLERMRRW